MASLAPKAVSPFIKFCRWGALVTGVTYGFFHYNWLARKEVGIQEHENAIKARIAAKKAKEKLISETKEMNALGKECGVPPIELKD